MARTVPTVAYSVLAGNHDVNSGTDDQRGPTPYLDTMGPQRFANSPTFIGASPGGYNTAHIFAAAGMKWLLLAMDWRTSSIGFAWANKVIKEHPHLPVILTTHEIAGPTYSDDVYPYKYGDPNNNASLRWRRDDPAVPLRSRPEHHRRGDARAVDP